MPIEDGDLRTAWPRVQGDNLDHHLDLIAALQPIAVRTWAARESCSRRGNRSVGLRRVPGLCAQRYCLAVTFDIEGRVRAICLAFPEVTEKATHGAPGFFVRKQFAMLWPNGHHDHEFAHLWCAAEAGAQEALTATSERYFRPPYVGHRGWVGVRLGVC